jgi:hypothetical protein
VANPTACKRAVHCKLALHCVTVTGASCTISQQQSDKRGAKASPTARSSNGVSVVQSFDSLLFHGTDSFLEIHPDWVEQFQTAKKSASVKEVLVKAKRSGKLNDSEQDDDVLDRILFLGFRASAEPSMGIGEPAEQVGSSSKGKAPVCQPQLGSQDLERSNFQKLPCALEDIQERKGGSRW